MISPLKFTPALNSVNTSIKRFRQVDNVLYRGGLPTDGQIKELKERGFKWVVSLKSGFDEKGLAEKEIVESLGMKYINFPVDSRIGPKKEVIDSFLNFMKTVKLKGDKTFIHCTHGRDRTGTFVGLYELDNKIKSLGGVVRELFAMDYKYDKHPNLLDIIINFAKNNV